MPRPKAKVISALKSKGFVEEHSDHIVRVYYATTGEKTTARTMTSHSPKMKDISDALISQMARQCKVSKSDFLALVDCPMSREKYEEALQAGDVI